MKYPFKIQTHFMHSKNKKEERFNCCSSSQSQNEAFNMEQNIFMQKFDLSYCSL